MWKTPPLDLLAPCQRKRGAITVLNTNEWQRMCFVPFLNLLSQSVNRVWIFELDGRYGVDRGGQEDLKLPFRSKYQVCGKISNLVRKLNRICTEGRSVMIMIFQILLLNLTYNSMRIPSVAQMNLKLTYLLVPWYCKDILNVQPYDRSPFNQFNRDLRERCLPENFHPSPPNKFLSTPL